MARPLAVLATAAVVALCAIGAVEGLARAAAMLIDPDAYARRGVEGLAAALDVREGTPEYAHAARLPLAMSAKLADMPGIALLHMIPGVLLLTLAPLQFWRGFRSRHPALHRWNGRLVLVLGALFGVAAIVLGVVRPTGGLFEASASLVFGAVFLLAGWRGYLAIRRRDIVRHREWMLRMFAIAVAASVIRLMAAAGIFLLGTSALTPRSFGLMFWAGFLVTSLAAELWLVRTRQRAGTESDAALQPL